MEVAALNLIGDASYEDGEELNATATAMGTVCCRLGCISCVMPFVGVESRNDDDDADDGFVDTAATAANDDDDDDDEEEEDVALRFDDDDVVPPYLIVLLMVDGRTMIFASEGSKSSVQSFRHLRIFCLFLSVT